MMMANSENNFDDLFVITSPLHFIDLWKGEKKNRTTQHNILLDTNSLNFFYVFLSLKLCFLNVF